MVHDDDQLIGLRALSRRLTVPARWIREEASNGRIPHIKAGSSLLFNLGAVERILAERARCVGFKRAPKDTSCSGGTDAG